METFIEDARLGNLDGLSPVELAMLVNDLEGRRQAIDAALLEVRTYQQRTAVAGIVDHLVGEGLVA